MTKEDAKPLIDAVRKAANDAFGDKAKSAKLPFQNDPETGDVIMAAKSKSSHSLSIAQAQSSHRQTSHRFSVVLN